MEEKQLLNIPVYLKRTVIMKNENKCIACGRCLEVCEKQTGAMTHYLKSNLQRALDCMGCAECLVACPSHALYVKETYDSLKKATEDPEKTVVISLAPDATRLFEKGNMVSVLHKLGADYVFNLEIAHGLMVLEQSMIFLKRILEDGYLPLITSFCPVGASFIQQRRPEWATYLSPCKNGVGIQGVTLKTYFAEAIGLSPENLIIATVTNCIAQKQEINHAFVDEGTHMLGIPHMKDNDYVITTEELIKWAREKGIPTQEAKRGALDERFNQNTDAYDVKTTPGHFTIEVLRHCYCLLNQGEMPPKDWLKFQTIPEMPHIQQTEVYLGTRKVRAAAVAGIGGRTQEWLEKNSSYDWIEVMACKGGCMREVAREPIKKEETYTSVLNSAVLRKVYDGFYEAPMSAISRQLLHTTKK